MLHQTLFVLLILAGISLNIVQISNSGYRCRCVLPGQCDDDELSSAKQTKIHRPNNEHHDSENDTHVYGNIIHPRILRGNEICDGGTEKCCGAIKPPSSYNPKPLFRSKHRCGIQKFTRIRNISTRITNDSQETVLGELPWNLLILDFHKKENDASYRCGASLIHPNVALTAGHCVKIFDGYENQITVRAGEWHLSNEHRSYEYQESRVEEILIHPQYVDDSLINDIALLFLAKGFTMGMNIGTICLDKTDLPERCTVSGWGKDAYKTGIYSNVLKKVDVPIVQREMCVRKLREIDPGKRFNLHRSFICAGGERNKDACKGDGGSPMVCWSDEHERFVQTGIVSWGVECGREIPGIYVNVMLYLEWIDDAMLSRDLDVSFYKISSN